MIVTRNRLQKLALPTNHVVWEDNHSKKNIARSSLKNRLTRWLIAIKDGLNPSYCGNEFMGRAVFLRFFFVSASLSDTGGFADCWVMAVRGVVSHKPSSNYGKGLWPLTLAQRVFLVLVIKLKPQGFIGCAQKLHWRKNKCLYEVRQVDSRKSTEEFAAGFLQIPRRHGHPCLWL